MKANRKFIEDGEAVSAVIGVILMVAITVAIAATVYVYVSGMLPTGSSSGPSMSMVQDAALSNGWVNFTIDSASTDAKWSDLKISIEGEDYGTPTQGATPAAGACGYSGSDTPVSADEKLIIHSDAATPIVAGDELAVIHVASNSRILTKTIY